MKITGYKLFQVPPRWLFLKIETDEGLVGWGEPVIEGKAATVKAAVEEFMAVIMGQNPMNIEDIWQQLYRGSFYRGGPVLMSAIAGIDQALWDLKGKYYNAPVYELLGGRCHDKMQVYSWIGGDEPSNVAANAKEKKAEGFTAIKMNGTGRLNYLDKYSEIDALVERVAAIREVCGQDFGIGIDFHGRVHRPLAKVLAKELEPLQPMFIEEPVLTENFEAFREIRNATTIPIATGERAYSRWDFKRIVASGYVDIIQPDPSHAGGITEVRKIAAMAEAYDVALAPHCPLGPIALASCLQIDACSYNAIIQEQSAGIHYNQGCDVLDYLKNPEVFSFADGYVQFSQGPGLGVEINEDYVLEKAKEGHDWHNPVWRHENGSVAEW